MLQAEIDSVMHGTPVLGSSGDESLDLFLSSAEQTYQGVQEEIKQRLPLFKQRPSDQIGQADLQEIFKECIGLINSGKGQSARFMAAAEGDVTQKRRVAERAFATATATLKPNGISDEDLSLRVHSLELMFDSLNANKIPQKIEDELRSGDGLTKFCLRDATGWFSYYLESRSVDKSLWYVAIKNTCAIWETDLVNACDALMITPAQEEQIAEMKKSLSKAWSDLAVSIVNALPSRQQLQANAQAVEDARPMTVGDFKRMYPKMSGFFNQNL
jgi:hypothetical protein